MRVEAGKVAEFARAVHAPVGDLAEPDVRATPTFLSTASHFWEPEGVDSIASLGFDVTRTLHGGETFVFHGPAPVVGAELQVETRLGEQYERTGKRGGKMRFGTIVRTFTDQTGRVVAEQHTTLIETAPRPLEGAS